MHLKKMMIVAAMGAMGTALAAAPAQAKQGDVLVRVRGIMVAPTETVSYTHLTLPTTPYV